MGVQPITDRVAQNLEIIFKNWQFSTRRTRILMGFFIYHLVLIAWDLSFITWHWSKIPWTEFWFVEKVLEIILRFCATLPQSTVYSIFNLFVNILNHLCIYAQTQIWLHNVFNLVSTLSISCSTFSAKEPLIIGLFFEKWPESNTLSTDRGTERRRPIGCLTLQVNFRKRATNYRALFWKMTWIEYTFNRQRYRVAKTHRMPFFLMGWLQLVGSLKLQVSFAEYGLFYRSLLQKRPIILRSLLIVATP